MGRFPESLRFEALPASCCALGLRGERLLRRGDNDGGRGEAGGDAEPVKAVAR